MTSALTASGPAALAVVFVALGIGLRALATPGDRDARLARVLAWLVGGYLATSAVAAALPATLLHHGRPALALALVLVMLAWAIGVRVVAVRSRLRLGLVACAALLVAHDLPLPWPADVRTQVDRVHPWPFAFAAIVTAGLVGPRLALRWLVDARPLAWGVVGALGGWLVATGLLALAEIPAAAAVASLSVFAIGGAALAVELMPVRVKLPTAVRETLPAVAALTDPEVVRRRIAEGLRSLFPGSAIEVFRLKGAPQVVLPNSREVSRALADVIAARGVMLVDDSPSLPTALANELAAFGRGSVVPIQFDSLLFGLLHVDHVNPTGEMIVVARRFADLLGHRIETLRLGHELEAQRRVATLGTVAAAVVHDLRSPLSSVRLNLQIATATDPRLAEDPGMLLAHAELARVESMLGGLLDLGRPRGGNRERIDVRDVASKVIERSRARARALGVKVELHADSVSAAVRGDTERIVRAVGNLVDNAFEAIDRGGRVHVRTVVDRGSACIEVIDEGHGDAAVLRERAAYTFSTDKPTGCGLGLLIVRDTAQAYGGRLEFSRNEPRGVTARFSLPIHEAETR
jgi:signal transduction histidine kinase